MAESEVSSGPRGLTGKESQLVAIIVEAASQGRRLTREQAGTAAGYGRGETARVQASRALARKPVREALMDALREIAAVDAAGAYAVVQRLMTASKSDRVRLDAANLHLRVAGMDQPLPGPTGPSVMLNLYLSQAGIDALNDRQTADNPSIKLHLAGAPRPAPTLDHDPEAVG